MSFAGRQAIILTTVNVCSVLINTNVVERTWETMMMNNYNALTDGGKRTCKYYKACGNTENCNYCLSYKKGEKHEKDFKIKSK